MSIKAIETRYKGYRFRSRLEARWAVFFDALNINYRYEADGYNLHGIHYLPDFQLLDEPKSNGYGDLVQNIRFIEIKPYLPTRKEWNKAVLLAHGTEKNVCIFAGDIGLNVTIFDISTFQVLPTFLVDIPLYACDKTPAIPPYMWSYANWCECIHCEKVWIVSEDLIDNGVGECFYCDYKLKNLLDPTSDRLVSAYETARSARFEHGEIPKV